jgi:hypothetical protein
VKKVPRCLMAFQLALLELAGNTCANGPTRDCTVGGADNPGLSVKVSPVPAHECLRRVL